MDRVLGQYISMLCIRVRYQNNTKYMFLYLIVMHWGHEWHMSVLQICPFVVLPLLNYLHFVLSPEWWCAWWMYPFIRMQLAFWEQTLATFACECIFSFRLEIFNLIQISFSFLVSGISWHTFRLNHCKVLLCNWVIGYWMENTWKETTLFLGAMLLMQSGECARFHT